MHDRPSPPGLPFSPAAERNRGPILAALERLLPHGASVLEIASGTGQHAEHFAQRRPDWRWQPSDGDPASLAPIDARCAGLPNVAPALHIDLSDPTPPGLLAGAPCGAVYCANLLHIAPWPVCGALMRLAAAQLRPGGMLVVYGPFIVDGIETAPGNLAFDASLRARDPRWGLRRQAGVQAEARAAGLGWREALAMPANNRLLVFTRPERAG